MKKDIIHQIDYKENCLLNNKYLTPSVIYEAKVTNDKGNDEEIYFALCKTPFNRAVEKEEAG